MKNISKFSGLLLFVLAIAFTACNDAPVKEAATAAKDAVKEMKKPSSNADAKSLALIKALEKVNGGWARIAAQKDVEFNYNYYNIGPNQRDVSTERYIFDGEHSWGDYTQHEANVLPGVEGKAMQAYVNHKPQISLDGKKMEEAAALGGSQFLRKANFYWFTMMYKLDDPGAINKYAGTEEVNGVTYDKVDLTYDVAAVGKEVNDKYVLYFNPETKLVDFFYFSLPAIGVNDPVLKMELDYEVIDGIYVATTRRGIFPNEKGEYNKGGEYISSGVKFNNGFKPADFNL